MTKITVKFYVSLPDQYRVKAQQEALYKELFRRKFADDSIHTGIYGMRISDVKIFKLEDCVMLSGAWPELFMGINYAPLISTFKDVIPGIALIKVYVQRQQEGFSPELSVRWSNDDAAYCKQCALQPAFALGAQYAINLLEGTNYSMTNRENLIDIVFQNPQYATIIYQKLEEAND